MVRRKIQSAYFCQNCGHQSSKWLGKCPACNQWNTFTEEIITKKGDESSWENTSSLHSPVLVQDISFSKEPRSSSFDVELDRVLGGGIVSGSVILLGGEPGIGKSTLLLQIALCIKDRRTVYVSGEESGHQIKMRSERINAFSDNCFILTETDVQQIFQKIDKISPNILVIDSIQTLHSSYIEASSGSVSQIRECSSQLIKYAKQTNTTIFLIGHINKDGAIAGPKILEHMVDTVLQFEGDRNHMYRILRSTKNRFGSASEIGVYEMTQKGLIGVPNPSKILISDREEETSGIAIASTIEGARPLLIEIQSLVSSAVYGTPQRSATGFDIRRLNMLLAVLEKRCGFKLGLKDVFLNITGGIRIDDTAIDLAIICSILSSDSDIPIGMQFCFAAEVGLSGEISAVNRIEQRILEAEKLGYDQIIISKFNKFDPEQFKIKIKKCSKIEEVVGLFF